MNSPYVWKRGLSKGRKEGMTINFCSGSSGRQNLPSLLSVVFWFVYGGSRKFAAAKLAFSPPCGGTVSDSFVRAYSH